MKRGSTSLLAGSFFLLAGSNHVTVCMYIDWLNTTLLLFDWLKVTSYCLISITCFTSLNHHPSLANWFLITAREKLTVCDVTNLPYMDINWQSISIYGYFVTSLSAKFSLADINISGDMFHGSVLGKLLCVGKIWPEISTFTIQPLHKWNNYQSHNRLLISFIWWSRGAAFRCYIRN